MVAGIVPLGGGTSLSGVGPTLTLKPTSGPSGTAVNWSGTGFTAGKSADIYIIFSYSLSPGGGACSVSPTNPDELVCVYTTNSTGGTAGDVNSARTLSSFTMFAVDVTTGAQSGTVSFTMTGGTTTTSATSSSTTGSSTLSPTISITPTGGSVPLQVSLSGSGFSPGTQYSVDVYIFEQMTQTPGAACTMIAANEAECVYTLSATGTFGPVHPYTIASATFYAVDVNTGVRSNTVTFTASTTTTQTSTVTSGGSTFTTTKTSTSTGGQSSTTTAGQGVSPGKFTIGQIVGVVVVIGGAYFVSRKRR